MHQFHDPFRNLGAQIYNIKPGQKGRASGFLVDQLLRENGFKSLFKIGLYVVNVL